ncbi:MAG: metallophosphoesterase [Candidatus Solibacter sp.]
MSLHGDLLGRLQELAQVQLVARLKDDRLNFPQAGELHVFIPDIHLITAARRVEGRYQYGSNHLDLLEAVVRGLREFRLAAAPGGEVVVYQIGDLFDLWRQVDGLDPNASAASAIQNDHASLLKALRDPDLNTQFLLGNHDYDLYRFPNFDAWQRSFVLAPSVMLLHGDVFDWVEKLPDEVQNLVLFLFHANQAGTAALDKMRPVNRKSRGGRKFRDFIQNQAPAPTGRWRDAEVEGENWNVQVEGVASAAMLLYLKEARAKCAEANQKFGSHLNAAVIGHTHHARIAVHDTPEEFFALLDCGAWIENCNTVDDPTPRANAQIAALGANEARIYQLSPRE